MAEQAFYYPVKMAVPMHAAPLEREVETVVVPDYSERCVANRDTVENRVRKIEPNPATLGMDLVAMPSVMVVYLIPKTIDLDV